jgi:hypothetical protein
MYSDRHTDVSEEYNVSIFRVKEEAAIFFYRCHSQRSCKCSLLRLEKVETYSSCGLFFTYSLPFQM